MKLNKGEREGLAQIEAVLLPLGCQVIVEGRKKHKRVTVAHPAVGRPWTILSTTTCSPDPRNLAYLRTWARRLARQLEK
jgi:hypothetical protein